MPLLRSIVLKMIAYRDLNKEIHMDYDYLVLVRGKTSGTQICGHIKMFFE